MVHRLIYCRVVPEFAGLGPARRRLFCVSDWQPHDADVQLWLSSTEFRRLRDRGCNAWTIRMTFVILSLQRAMIALPRALQMREDASRLIQRFVQYVANDGDDGAGHLKVGLVVPM